jgi:hypothetical protein
MTSWSHSGIPRGAVHDVDEDPRPLDVAQEGVAQAGAAAGPLDEAGHVGDRRSALVVVPRSITPRLGSSVVNG